VQVFRFLWRSQAHILLLREQRQKGAGWRLEDGLNFRLQEVAMIKRALIGCAVALAMSGTAFAHGTAHGPGPRSGAASECDYLSGTARTACMNQAYDSYSGAAQSAMGATGQQDATGSLGFDSSMPNLVTPSQPNETQRGMGDNPNASGREGETQ
jgi:hypothetical protein